MARRALPITSIERLEALTGRQRQTYSRTLQASRMMQGGLSRERAAREAGTTPRSISRYLGGATRKRDGRWRVRSEAQLYRYVWVPTTSGMQRLPASAEEAEVVRRYNDALWRYIRHNDDSGLADLEGESIGGFTLETDPAEIEEMIERGELDPSEVGSGETGRSR